MGFEHARRGYDCLVTTWKRTRIKNFCWTMDKHVVAVTVVRNVLLKRKRTAAERLERVRGEKAQASIFEKAGYGAVDVCCIDDLELLQSVTRKDDLDKREE